MVVELHPHIHLCKMSVTTPLLHGFVDPWHMIWFLFDYGVNSFEGKLVFFGTQKVNTALFYNFIRAINMTID